MINTDIYRDISRKNFAVKYTKNIGRDCILTRTVRKRRTNIKLCSPGKMDIYFRAISVKKPKVQKWLMRLAS